MPGMVDPRELAGVEDGAVEAYPHVAASASRHHAAEAGAEAARHARLERELGRGAGALAQRPHRLEHGGRTARIHERPRAVAELLGEELRDGPLQAGRAVVGCEACPIEQPGALGVGAIAEAEQDRCGHREAFLQDREGGDADAAADEDRPHPRGRRREAPAERAGHPQPLAPCELTQPPCARADILEQEVQLAVDVAGDREGPGQVGPLVLPAAPALDRRDHGELAGLGVRPVGVGRAQHAVGAEPLDAGDPQGAPAERGEAHATGAPSGLAGPAACSGREPCSSCRHRTSGSPSRRALAMARAAETAAESVVRHGIPCRTAALRISQPSVRAPTPVGVLTTRSTSPRSIQSSTCGEPSPILLRRCTGTPMRAIVSAVPRVATMRKPLSWRICATPEAPTLSESVTVMNAVPCSGSGTPAAAWALAKAVGKSRAMPMTSPVERISGPSTASEPSKRSKGSTASLTETCSPKPSPWREGASSSSAMRSPSMMRQASLASGTPTALETNGTVREARGLASITYRSPACTAYWTLISPTTPIASAISRVAARICSSMSSPSECGGSTQALSPECTPASSTCCMIPPIQTSLPSHSASTSTSVACSRKRSRKIDGEPSGLPAGVASCAAGAPSTSRRR